MLHVARRSQIGVRLRTAGHTVRLKLTHKQQHLAAAFLVVDIALTGGRIFCRGALALPMEQALVDGIIVVHGGWRIVLVRLVQRHKEHVDIFLRQPLHALTNGGRLHKVQRHQELVAGIGAVQIQRAVEAQLHRLVDKVDLLKAIAQQLQELTEQNCAVRQGIEVTKHLFVVPVLHSLTPDGDVKHLHHPLFRIRKRCKIKVVQTWKNIQ